MCAACPIVNESERDRKRWAQRERAKDSHFSFIVPTYRKLIQKHFIHKIPVRYTEVFSTQRCMEFLDRKSKEGKHFEKKYTRQLYYLWNLFKFISASGYEQ